MRVWICCLLAAACLTVTAGAAELPQTLEDALPESAEEIVEDLDLTGAGGFTAGISRLLERAKTQVGEVLRQRVKGAASVLLVVILCAAVDGFSRGTTGKAPAYLVMVGALSVTTLTAGSLDTLMGLGVETIGELRDFSNVLLPTLAAATAASGAVSTATFQQVTTVFLADLLLNLMDTLLMPMAYLYIGVLTASCCLGESRLAALAESLKKLLTWLLTTVLSAFTVYLSVVRVISGAADKTSVKLAKTAISGVVPVVGGIISDAAETVLAGAGLLKNTIGLLGMLTILAVCIYPFVQLGVQYLLYKLTAFLASAVGVPELCRLIDGLAGAFGLVLGMTGACALLLLVSVLACVAAVVP